MTEIQPVAWVERTDEGLTRMWSSNLDSWANRPANPEPLYSQAAVDKLRREADRYRRLLDETQENLESDVAAMPMFPITAENAEAAQEAMTSVCFTLGLLRVRDHDLVRAGEQGANA